MADQAITQTPSTSDTNLLQDGNAWVTTDTPREANRQVEQLAMKLRQPEIEEAEQIAALHQLITFAINNKDSPSVVEEGGAVEVAKDLMNITQNTRVKQLCGAIIGVVGDNQKVKQLQQQLNEEIKKRIDSDEKFHIADQVRLQEQQKRIDIESQLKEEEKKRKDAEEKAKLAEQEKEDLKKRVSELEIKLKEEQEKIPNIQQIQQESENIGDETKQEIKEQDDQSKIDVNEKENEKEQNNEKEKEKDLDIQKDKEQEQNKDIEQNKEQAPPKEKIKKAYISTTMKKKKKKITEDFEMRAVKAEMQLKELEQKLKQIEQENERKEADEIKKITEQALEKTKEKELEKQKEKEAEQTNSTTSTSSDTENKQDQKDSTSEKTNIEQQLQQSEDRYKAKEKEEDDTLGFISAKKANEKISKEDWVQMKDDLELDEEEGSEEQISAVRQKKILVCQRIIAYFIGKQDVEGRKLSIEAGVIDALLNLFLNSPLEQITIIHFWAFYTHTHPATYEIQQLLFDHSPYASLLRLLDHPNVFVVNRAVNAIFNIQVGAGNITPEDKPHPHFMILSACGGIKKLYALFWKDVSKFSKDRAAICIGQLYHGKEIIDRAMRREVIAHLKTLQQDPNSDQWTRNASKWAIIFLSMNKFNLAEIEKDDYKIPK